MNTIIQKYLIMYFIVAVLIGIMLACSGGDGGIGPVPTFTTDTFPSFTISSTTTTTTFPITTTTSNSNYKYLYVKVLRKTNNGDIQWLGSYDWNETAYVYFQANNNWNNNKNVYVNDGYYGSYTQFNYDRYTVSYVDIGIYRYYLGDYRVKIGNFYEGSSEAWYGQFTVDFYNPYGNSIYIEFQPNITSRRIR